ncbi:NUDIX domain-containing protein [Kitasatospora sp. LaBMicrA B282]|uniref:NUDIX domain-containing protein n=1 Tax=Kitasatospora sp. LaBMicrA B282 TaxID=3420949 RepID=UPI003D12BB3F
MSPSRTHNHDLVQAYLAFHPGERDRLAPLLTLLDAGQEPTSRATLPAHVTCSAVVIRPDLTVLHIHHKATGLVICPGGHVEEGDATLLGTALREVHEEAGIPPGALCMTPQTLAVPLDIDINDIDPNPAKGEGAHQHFDFRFAFCLLPGQADVVLQTEEVTGAEWRPLDQVASPSLRAKLLASGITGQAEPVNASALIHDGAGRYLLHLRDNHPGIWAPGEWSLPGGGRERQDATLTDTLLRELAEEAPDLALADLQPFAVEYATGVDGLCVPVQIYTGRWNGDPDTVDLHEGVMLRWFTPDMLHRLLLRTSTIELVHRHAAQHPTAGRLVRSPGSQAVRAVVGVHLYLEDDQGRVLLGRRHPNSAFAADTWHVLAGHCEQESAITCLVREAMEEAGLVIDPADVQFAHAVHLVDAPGAQPRLGLFFRVRSWKGMPELREPDRCTAWQWFHPHALPERLVAYTRAAIDGIRAGQTYTELGWE